MQKTIWEEAHKTGSSDYSKEVRFWGEGIGNDR